METTRIYRVSSSEYRACDVCGDADAKAFDDRVNHFIGVHGCELLHLGQETDRSDRGELWQATVAILGHAAQD